jgi:hypothetical protein
VVGDRPEVLPVTTIPRNLHQIWLGPDPPPEAFVEWREEFRRMHPHWNHFLWTDEAAAGRRLANRDLWLRAPDIAGDSIGQFRADLLRYEVLSWFGGVYVDMDCEPLRPLDPLIEEGHTAFCGWEIENVWANNAVLGATKGHPFLADLIAALPAWVDEHYGARPNVLSGPQFLTPHLWSDVHVYPREYFYPYGYGDVGTARERGPFPDSYLAHHWSNTRRRRAIRTKEQRREIAFPVRERDRGR